MMGKNNEFFVGVDVAHSRDCAYFVLNEQFTSVDSGWLSGNSNSEICAKLIKVINNFDNQGQVSVGIDAPRFPLLRPRNNFWNHNHHWRPRKEGEKGYGRHCEVILKALKLANPQYTPVKGECPPWMVLGFDLFSCIISRKGVFEVFPSASYSMLKKRSKPKVSINFSAFYYNPKDMIDACVSAVTVLEFLKGRGCEVGGGDGLGTIILPTPLPIDPLHPILKWPE